jgi:adenosylmethionine-8-amino-7-oxononanoate aminotransferase
MSSSSSPQAATSSSSPPSSPEWLARGAPHVWRPYCQHQTAPPPLPVVSAHGSRLVLADGRELVDGIASWWTAAHGYQHPHLVTAIQQQAERLCHVAFGGLAHAQASTLCARLAGLLPAPLSRVFLVESGSVAVEVALKMCRQAFANTGRPQKRRVLAFAGAYHGDTFATMALCDPHDGMHTAFVDVDDPRGPLHVALPASLADTAAVAALDDVVAAHAHELAAIIVEPLLQGAGGMRLHDAGVLRHLRALGDAWDVKLIFDEIATGFFRLGPRFALDEAGVVPDVVTLGKALTGGTLPLACAVAREDLFACFLADDARHALQHGPTYMGNALACAAAHASLDLFDAVVDGVDASGRVRRLEGRLRDALDPLRALPGVRDVRVKGAMAAIELPPGTAPSSLAFAGRGAFIRPLRLSTADVVYVTPPHGIDDVDLAVLMAAITAEVVDAAGR